MLEQAGQAVSFYAHFTDDGAGATGLTVTVDVWRDTTQIVTAGNAVELGDGLYLYTLAAGSTGAAGSYAAVFHTAGTADQTDIPALWVIGSAWVEHVDADVSSRNAVEPPSVGDVADAVWDETAADHEAAGTTGALLAASGSAADPLLNAVPGSYASGSAGAALGRIGSGQVTIVAPVANDGAITLVYGDDYLSVDGRALTFAGDNWPVLTDGAVVLRVQAAAVVSVAGVVTGAAACYVELEAADVESIGRGVYAYDLEATLSNGSVVTLQQGYVAVRGDVR